MEENNDNNESIIHKSFISLLKLFEKGNKNVSEKEKDKSIDENFDQELFCCKECYDKFINVAKKIKDNKIDLTKIDWGKYPDSQNIIVKLVTYYYNLGLQNANK